MKNVSFGHILNYVAKNRISKKKKKVHILAVILYII